MIIRYFVSRQKRQEYNWHQIDNWPFRSSLPTGRLVFPAYGRQASSVPIIKENKATGIIADYRKAYFKLVLNSCPIKDGNSSPNFFSMTSNLAFDRVATAVCTAFQRIG